MILKFGSFVVLLDPLKIFQNPYVQMSDLIVIANQKFHHAFPMGSHKSAMSIAVLSQTCNGAKLYMSVVDTCCHY